MLKLIKRENSSLIAALTAKAQRQVQRLHQIIELFMRAFIFAEPKAPMLDGTKCEL